MEGFKQDFYRRHTTDTYQDKKEKHYLTFGTRVKGPLLKLCKEHAAS